MIGIDLVDVRRFETSPHLTRYIKRFGVDGTSALAVAKTWACIEAVIKAEPQAFCPTDIRIVFEPGQAPRVSDPGHVLSCSYCLSMSHEGPFVIAIAVAVC